MGAHYLVYVRQSYRRIGDNADADVSPEAQEKAARRALPEGSTAEVIADSGGHRSGRTDDRDGYQQLIRRLADPDVAGVAVYDLSRLARNARLMLNLKHELDRRNLRLIVSNLPDSRFDTAVGRFLFGQLCQAAQFQADVDSERMVGITRTKHERGGHNGSDPFGYTAVRDEHGRIVQPHRLAVVEAEAEMIRHLRPLRHRGREPRPDRHEPQGRGQRPTRQAMEREECAGRASTGRLLPGQRRVSAWHRCATRRA
jgi:DNA invertase Pin-like site-specific DNA recombinase